MILADLAYQDLEYAQKEMQQRGYNITFSSAAQQQQYWWNAKTKSCALVALDGRKVGAITNATPKACKK